MNHRPTPRPRVLALGLALLLAPLAGCLPPSLDRASRGTTDLELAVEGPQVPAGQAELIRGQLALHLRRPVSAPSAPEAAPRPGGRVLRMTLRLQPHPYEGAGVVKTVALSSGQGAVVGAYVGLHVQPLAGTAVGAGVGATLGVAVSPLVAWQNHQSQKALGYLPWHASLEWQVFQRGGDGSEGQATRGRDTLVLRPFAVAIPTRPASPEAVRAANLQAACAALEVRLKALVDGDSPPPAP